MSKNPIRKDKTCLNCNHVVDQRFCPNCGQENSDTRKTFHHLFIHFFEDLTHYENAFWKTIKNLLFKPASLTKEYLSGKRLSYLAPIRLYIFISFVTFFIISLLPSSKDDFIKTTDENKTEKSISKAEKDTVLPQVKKIQNLFNKGELTKKEADTLISYAEKSNAKNNGFFHFGKEKYKSIKELDSVQKIENKKIHPVKYWLTRKLMKSTQNKTGDEIGDAFLETFQKNIPKALFIYMPIFAFLLWLFHNKKRWYYFDHGIFTLHYFSFLLAIILLYNILDSILLSLGKSKIFEYTAEAITAIVPIWAIIYFFKAHRRFYDESRTISIIKSIGLSFLNLIFIMILLIGIAFYSLITIH